MEHYDLFVLANHPTPSPPSQYMTEYVDVRSYIICCLAYRIMIIGSLASQLVDWSVGRSVGCSVCLL